MGFIKANSYQENLYATALIFKALGHPARLQILQILLSVKSATCGEIVGQLPLVQSTVSKHLLELKKAKIVSLKVVGKKTIYSLVDDNIDLTKEFLTNHVELSKKDKSELPLENYIYKSKSKKINRKANPGLKFQNYEFSHLKINKKS